MSSTQHALPLRHRPAVWTGVLAGLLGVLTHEASGRPIGTWSHRLLRGGALVSLKLTPEKRRVLRFARDTRPTTPEGRERWAREVQVFLTHFRAETWQPQPAESATGVVARFLELFAGEVAPGKACCPNCRSLVSFHVVWGRARDCATCAERSEPLSNRGHKP